jgi:hypothetical protein
VPPPTLPDEDPGQLIEQSNEVAPGGNAVLSYPDVVAPDETPWSEISRAIITFISLVQQRPLPWVGAVGRCTFRFGLGSGLAASWRHELALLLSALERIQRQPVPEHTRP